MYNNNNEYAPRTFTHEGSPIDRVWERFYENLWDETTSDGLLKELEGYIDLGFNTHLYSEWRLPQGVPIQFPDDKLFIVPRGGMRGIGVYKLYMDIEKEWKTDYLRDDPEVIKEILRMRLIQKYRIVRNMNGENGFLQKKKKFGLIDQFLQMKRGE